MPFQIRLLPSDIGSLDASKREIILRTQELAERVKTYNPELANDLSSGRFWGTLNRVDGRTPLIPGVNYDGLPIESREKVAQKNRETRAKAKETFSEPELEEILNVAVNQALLRTHPKSWPGSKRGHSILYEDLIDKQDSMFQEAVTEDLRRRLNNGRFWEELPFARPSINNGRGIYIVKAVLEDYFEHLDVDFAVTHGLSLMRQATEDKPLGELQLLYLGEIALGRYVQLLSLMEKGAVSSTSDKKQPITPTVIEELLHPYLSTVLSWNTTTRGPYYNGEKDEDDLPVGRFQDKLQLPLVQKYIEQSPGTKRLVAKMLINGIGLDNEDGQYSQFVTEVLGQVPKPSEIMGLMLLGLMNDTGREFFRESKLHQYNLEQFIPNDLRPPNAGNLLITARPKR